ncbi:MAG: hypothetical protein HWD85_01675 [Flavobacteriaceae bacterium]|nr:hypothetical protein [Flavobacteriaceae bacterium]
MKTTIKKYLSEGLLIVFSVLFALFINRMSENATTEKRKKIAIENIKKEISTNLKVLGTWQEHHKKMYANITNLLNNKNDSVKNQLKSGKYFNFSTLSNNLPLINSIISNTAWETSKATQIISEFDFKTIQELTQTYTMQEILLNNTLKSITNLYFNAATHNLQNLDATLLQFNLLFNELVGQEQTLSLLYKETLKFLQAYE